MAISASLVKELRVKTNAGMMECKKALTETNGDMEEAIKYLRERGIVKAAKKADRETNEGVVAAKLSEDGKSGILAKISCETDFVARNENFVNLVETVATTLVGASAADKAAALEVPYADGTVGSLLESKVIELGEKLDLSDYARYEIANGAVTSYIHMGGKVGVLLQVSFENAETAQSEVFQEMCKDINLHIAALNPQGLAAEDIPAELIEAEKEIYAKQLLEEGKPEAMIEKILPGKLNRFYKDNCLLKQPFVKDGDVTIEGLLAAKGKELGDTLSIVGYSRLAV